MKTVAMYRPVSTIDRAMSDFDRYLESFFGESPLSPACRNSGRLPAMDVRETDDAYSVEMDLPGFDEKSVEVNLDGKVITVESKAEEANEEKKENFVLRERRSSTFKRSFTLPENADYETISAKFNNGVLTLDVKKLPEAKKRTIEIGSK